MARGKYSSAAAKRRAESAEEQMDRLLPQLVDAKRTAHQYKAEAARVPVLSRQLAELKDKVGVPREQYEYDLKAVRAECDECLQIYEDAMKVIFDRLADAKMLRPVEELEDIGHVDEHYLAAFYVIPDHVTAKLLTALGWERDMRRWAFTPEGVRKFIEGRRGKRSRYGGGKLSEVSGDLGEEMVKFLSNRRDEREFLERGADAVDLD